MRFWKCEAAGNDFVFLRQPVPAELDPQFLQRLCARRTGIGADGVVFVWEGEGAWQWRYFNSDGSEADLCGNAARATALWLQCLIDPKRRQWEWQGKLGLFRARFDGEHPQVCWPHFKAESTPLPESLRKDTQKLGMRQVVWVQVGVPHLVLISEGPTSSALRQEWSEKLRRHPALAPDGANVTWLNKTHQTAVTYERGVEAETLACGSGAMAAFVACLEDKELAGMQHFRFPGGELRILQDEHGLWLSGPASLIFEGEIE